MFNLLKSVTACIGSASGSAAGFGLSFDLIIVNGLMPGYNIR